MLKPIFERWKKTLNAHVYSKCDSQIIEMGFRNEVYDVDINIGYSFWNHIIHTLKCVVFGPNYIIFIKSESH